MTRQCHNHTVQTNPQHREEEANLMATWLQEDKESKAISSLSSPAK